MNIKNTLLTGNPGVGKTTIIRKIIYKIPKNLSEGFYTEEIREKGIRKGFKIICLGNAGKKEGILATTDVKTNYRVGKYFVNIDDLENIAGRSIENALSDKNKKFIIIDEIGKMELFSKRFQELVIKALDSEKYVVGVIKEKPNSFTDKIKKRQDVEIIYVTAENRDNIPDEILKMLSA